MEEENSSNKFHLNKMLIIFVNVIVVFFAFVALCVTIFNMLYVSTAVEGYSMLPTLNSTQPNGNAEGDIVYINRFMQGKKGDIVVADVDWAGSELLIIKRLVATEGDKIKVIASIPNNSVKLFVNDKLYKESCIENNGSTSVFYSQFEDYKTNHPERFDENDYLTIEKNEVYVLGDNWMVSRDCSYYGPINKNCIIGRVDFIIPYQNNVYSTLIGSIFDFFKI